MPKVIATKTTAVRRTKANEKRTTKLLTSGPTHSRHVAMRAVMAKMEHDGTGVSPSSHCSPLHNSSSPLPQSPGRPQLIGQ